MPFRLGPEHPYRAKIQFITAASMPNRIYEACLATGTVSNTRYCQEALCEKLARDLNLPVQNLLDELPPPRGAASHPIARTTVFPGPANTIEEVR